MRNKFLFRFKNIICNNLFFEVFKIQTKHFLQVDGNNPTTPLNNLDPKFYDTPRSHNNIGLNLTNDQSYSPKITNCSLVSLLLGTID